MKNKGTGIQRGQAITFRLPSDTPDHIIKQLQKLKETERRNFSSKIAEFALEGVSHTLSKERETITIPLPKQLNKEQRNWLRHSHSEALLGSVIYQLLADPVRATAVLASLNSNALDINEALYLQEDKNVIPNQRDTDALKYNVQEEWESPEEAILNNGPDEQEDDLMNFNWNKAKQEYASAVEETEEEKEEDVDDLLGGFLAHMNK